MNAASREKAPESLKKICFISLKSYDLLSHSAEPSFIGGAERQQVLVGRGLRELGYDVSFITLGPDRAGDTWCDGIRVLRAYDPNRGFPGLRALMPRWTGLWSAMHRANADIYHQMCADMETGQVAGWCRRHGRKFIFSVASDADCDSKLPLLRTRRQRWFYRYGLRHADRVITQTTLEQSALKRSFGIDSTIIQSCALDAASPISLESQCPKGKRPCLLWVSRIVPLKRLEWFLAVAEKCPNYDFVVAGGGDEEDPYVRKVLSKAAQISNVRVLGRVPDPELWRAYGRADLLLDTAAIAGVPTTFLEAWAHGVPVVSTVDLDGALENNRIGIVVSSIEGMVRTVSYLLTDPATWMAYSRSSRAYYVNHHTVGAVCRRYVELLEGMYASQGKSGFHRQAIVASAPAADRRRC